MHVVILLFTQLISNNYAGLLLKIKKIGDASTKLSRIV